MKKMCESLEKQMYVTKLLLSLGVPAHLKGYHYLRSAILRSEQDIEVVSSVTKLLYPDVAREYNTSVQKVERAIRNAIEVSWMRGNIESMEEMFGFSAHSGKGRPTNSEYIARVADAVHLETFIQRIERGLNKKTSLPYLNERYEKGKMNKQEIYPEATWRGYLLFLQDMK